jgi:hypothetical protein
LRLQANVQSLRAPLALPFLLRQLDAVPLDELDASGADDVDGARQQILASLKPDDRARRDICGVR